jgi:hypothetical protein
MPEEAAEELFEGVRSSPQALKRKHIFDGLAARLEVVPFPFPGDTTLSALCEGMPGYESELAPASPGSTL